MKKVVVVIIAVLHDIVADTNELIGLFAENLKIRLLAYLGGTRANLHPTPKPSLSSERSEHAVLNANYLRHAIHREAKKAGVDHLFVDGAETDVAKHEFTLSMQPAKEAHGISAMDVAKGLLDRGYMAPTVYFPLVVPECMMIEPTETESKDTLDTFAEHFAQVLKTDPETLHEAPITTPVRRVDEVYAARNLCLRHPYDDA